MGHQSLQTVRFDSRIVIDSNTDRLLHNGWFSDKIGRPEYWQSYLSMIIFCSHESKQFRWVYFI